SWEEDARRRDFTINAIYLAPDGTVHDPVGGAADLAARRVRFIGEARRRIAEDVLRLLRYYRFEARFGAGAGDAEARAACRAAAPALAALSAGRVTQELLGLLAAPEAARAVRLMHEDGVLAVLLPEAAQLDRPARPPRRGSPCRPRRGGASPRSPSRGRSPPRATTGPSAAPSTGSAASATATSPCCSPPPAGSRPTSSPAGSVSPQPGRSLSFR